MILKIVLVIDFLFLIALFFFSYINVMLLGQTHQCLNTMMQVVRKFSTAPLRGLSSSLKDANTKALIDKIVRVDHALEFGADIIYTVQLAVLGRSEVGPLIKEMWEVEKVHRKNI